jgi:sec-independent protein translocase protein TatB
MGTPPPIELGSLGMADSLILMVLALVVFGPRRLPQIGRQIGKLMYEFRKASNDFKFQMEEELRLSEDADRRKKEEEKRKQQAQESVSASPAVVNALEPPYPGETQYPDGTSAESNPVEPEPRILPPSTGETVAVDRRPPLAEPADPPTNTAVAEPEPASTATSVVSGEPAAHAAPDQKSPASETTVSQNG